MGEKSWPGPSGLKQGPQLSDWLTWLLLFALCTKLCSWDIHTKQVAAIGIFDTFKVEEFDPEDPDPELFRRRSNSTGGEVTNKTHLAYYSTTSTTHMPRTTG